MQYFFYQNTSLDIGFENPHKLSYKNTCAQYTRKYNTAIENH